MGIFAILQFVGFVIWGVIGFFIGKLMRQGRVVGTLRVDTSNEDGSPYLFLEVNDVADINNIGSNDYVRFKVKIENYIPRK